MCNTNDDVVDVVSLLQDDYIFVKCIYPGNPIQYDYKATKDMGIKVGDQVIVDSPFTGYTVVTVVGVDEDPFIQADLMYKWVVQKIDDKEYKERLNQEEQAKEFLQKAYRKKKKDSRFEAVKKRFGDGVIGMLIQKFKK